MEKNILIQSLKDKVGEDNCKSISDKTFEAMADVYMPLFADDSAITEDTWKMPVTSLIQFAGQKRHDEKVFAENLNKQHQKDVDEKVRVAVEKAIEEYKANQHLEDQKNKDGKTADDADDDVDAKIAAQVAKAFEQLTGENGAIGKLNNTLNGFIKTQTEREKTAQINSVKAALKQHLQDLKASNEACIEDALDSLDYGDNPVFGELKQTAIAAYEKRYKRYYGDGGKPFGGDSTGGNGGTGSLIKDHIERAKQQAEDAKDYADSLEFAK